MTMTSDGSGAWTPGADDRLRAIAAVKAVLRVSASDEDALIGTLADSALGIAERFIGQALIARPMQAEIAASAGWRPLPVLPVRAITGVAAAGDPPLALPSDRYAIDIDANGAGWVRAGGLGCGARLLVSFTAGSADGWGSLPPAVAQGIALLAAFLFDRRDGGGAPPAAVTALWRPYRTTRLACAEHRA